MPVNSPIKRFISKMLPQRFVWFLSRSLYNIGYYKPFLWDILQSERIVEYGWVLNNLGDTPARVLDVGCGGTFFPLVLASMGFEVWGLDRKLYTCQHPNFRFIHGDILEEKLPDNFFNIIILISTIEHIGLKNDGDFGCMNRIYASLQSHGKVIMTAPFGKPATFEGYRVYDMKRLNKICGGKIEKINFFIVDGQGKWIRTNESTASNIEMKSRGECKAIFCAVLRK